MKILEKNLFDHNRGPLTSRDRKGGKKGVVGYNGGIGKGGEGRTWDWKDTFQRCRPLSSPPEF